MPYPFNVTPAGLPNAYEGTAQSIQSGPDATAEFYEALNDPTRWVIKQGVPIFKPHERVDPATGKQIKVDVPKMYRIVNNMSQLERGGVPIRMTVGHTEPGKPEHQQPPVAGYYRNARVQPFGPKQEPAVVVDEWLDPQYAQNRKNYPYRSAEYYDDAEQITGVALLARDPFLDLGVVAYSRGQQPVNCSTDTGMLSYTSRSPLATMYAANPYTGRQPVMYRLTLGELPMYPPAPPVPQTPQAVPGSYPIPPQYPQPNFAVPPAGPFPTPYGAPPAAYAPPPSYAPPTPYGYPAPPAPPTAYEYPARYGGRERLRRPPVSGAWLFRGDGAPTGYAGEMPPGGGGNPLQAVYEGLAMAMEALQAAMEGGSQAPQSPMPPGGMDGNPMTPAARYAMGHHGGRGDVDRRHFRSGQRDMRGAQRRDMREDDSQHRLVQPRNPDGERGYARYQEPGAPSMYTISGRPVGQQLEIDRLNYQLQHTNQALRMLMYERDQSDTAECIAEIRRLADAGYAVSEIEIGELKSKPREYRAAYLQNIVTKYQKVPTEVPPPLLGDPTPGPTTDQTNRPISKEEMEQALAYAAANPTDPNGYNTALNYMRNPQPTQYQHPAMAGIPPFRRSFPPPEAAGAMNYDQPMPQSFVDPYPEPGQNGQY